MPVFKYNGERTNMKGCFGYDFSNHLPVTVHNSDELAIRKFTNNSHFDLIGGENEQCIYDEREDLNTVNAPADDPDINCDYGVFRVKEDGQNYSKPDKVFDKKEDAQSFIAGIFDDKNRIILRRTKA